MSTRGLLPLARHSAWLLSAEGAAVHVATGTAVIADVHLGYEWARGARGDSLPPHSLAETLAKLDILLGRIEIRRVVVAGDLVETPRPCVRTARDVRALVAWLGTREIEPIFLRGNHDPPRRPPLPLSLELDGWTILHGDRDMPDGPTLFGHHHPALRDGRPGRALLPRRDRVRSPCPRSPSTPPDWISRRRPCRTRSVASRFVASRDWAASFSTSGRSRTSRGDSCRACEAHQLANRRRGMWHTPYRDGGRTWPARSASRHSSARGFRGGSSCPRAAWRRRVPDRVGLARRRPRTCPPRRAPRPVPP